MTAERNKCTIWSLANYSDWSVRINPADLHYSATSPVTRFAGPCQHCIAISPHLLPSVIGLLVYEVADSHDTDMEIYFVLLSSNFRAKRHNATLTIREASSRCIGPLVYHSLNEVRLAGRIH